MHRAGRGTRCQPSGSFLFAHPDSNGDRHRHINGYADDDEYADDDSYLYPCSYLDGDPYGDAYRNTISYSGAARNGHSQPNSDAYTHTALSRPGLDGS